MGCQILPVCDGQESPRCSSESRQTLASALERFEMFERCISYLTGNSMSERFILAYTLGAQSITGENRGSESKLYLSQQEHGVTGHMSIVRKRGNAGSQVPFSPFI